MYTKKDFFKNFNHVKVRKLKNFYYDQYGITWNEILTVPAFNQSLKDVLKLMH